ncbi:MAG: NERD domain-containing protein [Ruminococcus sp.]|nr:NERD domain-containing protein [Ruminococcus sp.]
MEINWKSQEVKLDQHEINIEEIRNVKKIEVSFLQVRITFLCVQTGQNKWNFYYENEAAYDRLIQLIAGEKKETGVFLKKYKNTFNEMHALWKLLLGTAVHTFGLNQYTYIREVGLDSTSDYTEYDFIGYRYGQICRITSIPDAYACLVSVLPENIEETRRAVQEKEARERKRREEEQERKRREEEEEQERKRKEEERKRKKREEGRAQERKRKEEEKRERLKSKYADRQREISSSEELSDTVYRASLWKSDLPRELRAAEGEIAFWEEGMRAQVIQEDWCMQRICTLRHRIEIINSVYEKKLSEKLADQHGSIENLKTGLLKIINGLTFQEGLSFFYQYQKVRQELKQAKKSDIFRKAVKPYDPYIEFYQKAGVFISNYLNEINKYKSKRVSIPQSQINAALMYMYNAHTVEEAYALRQQKDYIESRSFGNKGEAEVDYALKWLVGDYIKIERTPSGKYGELAIVLNNKALIDEPQEFDHIVIGPQGVFNIETKNYVGKLIVDRNGNWIRVKDDGREVGERNPIQQIRRHEAVLRSIVGEDVPIVSILVMANPRMIIEGVENFSLPLLKSDRLEEYISTYRNEKVYTKSEIEALREKLEQYRVSK